MRTFNFNLAFVIIFIFFCCSAAIGSPPLGAEFSASYKNSLQIPIGIKEETWSLTIEEILSPKKYLKRYLETAKKEGLHEKSPDREYQPIIVEKETPSTAVEKDAHPAVSIPGHPTTPVTGEQFLIGEEKGTQTPGVDNMPLPAVTGQESPSPSPFAVEESVTKTYAEDNEPLPSITGEEPSPTVPVEEMDYQGKSLTDEGHQRIVAFPETFQETKEESTPMKISTP
ncbi:MAG: hypothetical protein QG591_2177, partial [Planctomycetota bacterium]|nr:hypothetical protein [Planctomycetota bacterium]